MEIFACVFVVTTLVVATAEEYGESIIRFMLSLFINKSINAGRNNKGD